MAAGNRHLHCGSTLVILIFLIADFTFQLPCCEDLPEFSSSILTIDAAHVLETINGESCLCCSPVPVGVPPALALLHTALFASKEQSVRLPSAPPVNLFHPPPSPKLYS